MRPQSPATLRKSHCSVQSCSIFRTAPQLKKVEYFLPHLADCLGLWRSIQHALSWMWCINNHNACHWSRRNIYSLLCVRYPSYIHLDISQHWQQHNHSHHLGVCTELLSNGTYIRYVFYFPLCFLVTLYFWVLNLHWFLLYSSLKVYVYSMMYSEVLCSSIVRYMVLQCSIIVHKEYLMKSLTKNSEGLLQGQVPKLNSMSLWSWKANSSHLKCELSRTGKVMENDKGFEMSWTCV